MVKNKRNVTKEDFEDIGYGIVEGVITAIKAPLVAAGIAKPEPFQFKKRKR